MKPHGSHRDVPKLVGPHKSTSRKGGGKGFGGLTMRKAAPPVSSMAWMAVSTSRLDFSSCSLYRRMRPWTKPVLSPCSWAMRCSSSDFFSSSSATKASKRAHSSRLAASLFSCRDEGQGMPHVPQHQQHPCSVGSSSLPAIPNAPLAEVSTPWVLVGSFSPCPHLGAPARVFQLGDDGLDPVVPRHQHGDAVVQLGLGRGGWIETV